MHFILRFDTASTPMHEKTMKKKSHSSPLHSGRAMPPINFIFLINRAAEEKIRHGGGTSRCAGLSLGQGESATRWIRKPLSGKCLDSTPCSGTEFDTALQLVRI